MPKEFKGHYKLAKACEAISLRLSANLNEIASGSALAMTFGQMGELLESPRIEH